MKIRIAVKEEQGLVIFFFFFFTSVDLNRWSIVLIDILKVNLIKKSFF